MQQKSCCGIWIIGLLGLLVFWQVPKAEAFRTSLGRGHTLKLKLKQELRYFYLNDFPVDLKGTSSGDPGNGKIFHRLRAGAGYEVRDLMDFYLELQAFSLDSMYGYETDAGKRFDHSIQSQGEGLRWFELRELHLTFYLPFGVIKTGLVRSHWGTGLIANGGKQATGEFGQSRFGDMVGRLSLITPVFSLFTNNRLARRILLGISFDVVVRDENAELFKGDFGLQGAFSLFYRDRQNFFGFYAAIRRQTDRTQTVLNGNLFDIFARTYIPLDGNRMKLYVEAEAALLTGSTNRIRSDSFPGGVELYAGGGVAKLGVILPKFYLRAGFEVGYASGDANQGDSVSQSFRFDPDYQPSMILFQRVLGALSAHAAERAVEPSRVGVPSPGTELIPTRGSVTNAIYGQFVVAYRPFQRMKGLEDLEFKVGVLLANAATDWADPFASFQKGGENYTHLGQPAKDKRSLGFEINAAVNYKVRLWRFDLDLSLLYGRFFPGEFFKDKQGKSFTIDQFQFQSGIAF